MFDFITPRALPSDAVTDEGIGGRCTGRQQFCTGCRGAMPDQENATTIDENQIDNTMQDAQDIAVLADNYPATGKITAKIYLRYSNAIPQDINQDFGMDEFGPSGNNTPYFTVTVDLDQLNKSR